MTEEKEQTLPVQVFEKVNIDRLDPAQIRERVTKLCRFVQVAYIEIAEALDHIRKNKLYKDYGFTCFNTYCEQELGFHERKGQYFVAIYRTMLTETPLTKDDVGSIPWRKAAELLPLAKAGLMKTEEDAKEWLREAEESTVEELSDKVGKKLQTSDTRSREQIDRLDETSPLAVMPTPDEPIKKITFGLYPSQLEEYERALARARAVTGSDAEGYLVECICLAYNAEAWDSKKVGLNKICESIERIFGVRVIAIDPNGQGDDKIAFGAETLGAFVEEPASERKEE